MEYLLTEDSGHTEALSWGWEGSVQSAMASVTGKGQSTDCILQPARHGSPHDQAGGCNQHRKPGTHGTVSTLA